MNAFLASGGRVDKNLKALLMKATESLGGGVREKILSYIHKILGGSNSVVVKDCEW